MTLRRGRNPDDRTQYCASHWERSRPRRPESPARHENREIVATIRRAIGPLHVDGKTGKRLLQGTIAAALRTAGFDADEEDKRQFLKVNMPVWRDKETRKVEVTTSRRLIDIVVYRCDEVVGLIETESDLDDLRVAGVTRRNGHYDVFSIARSGSGEHFHSYKSLERMAAAAYYRQAVPYPTAMTAEGILDAIRSDDPKVHNPRNLPLFLVTGHCRARDLAILEPRLKSLDAELIPVRMDLGAA